MTTPQKLPASGASKVNNEDVMENFPAGLRVLVVDDDMTCLRVLEQMLRRCLYQAVTCTRATVALSLLRERKGSFDIVISDVHMPDMDGFKLLEHVGLEMDLPVIMMSADGSTSAVMWGIQHGACDYLIKPVRIEELKNIWQHVVRKKFNENKEHENSGSVEDSDRNKRGGDDAEYASSVNDATDSCWKSQKKKREAKEDEDDGELENDDPSASKKPRVVWSVELHQQFVSAVNQLGIDKAVPKRILELMSVPGLTRENVASHLQKFRLYLKRLSGMTQHHSSYSGSVETNPKVNPLGGLDLQALAASSQIPPEALVAALQAELLGRPSGSMVLPVTDQTSLFQTSVPGPKYTPLEHGLGFGQSLVKCQTNMAKQFQQNKVVSEDPSSGFSDWSASNVTACSAGNISGLSNLQNSDMLAQILPQKCSQPTLPEAGHPVSMQPSCLVVPSQSSTAYQVGSNSNLINPSSLTVPAQQPNPYQVGHNLYPVNQNFGFGNGGTILDYAPLSSQRGEGSFCLGQSDGHLKGAGPLNGGSLINGFLVSRPISSPFSSGLASVDGSNGWRVSSSVSSIPTLNASRLSTPYLSDLQGSTSGVGLPDQMQATSLGFVGKGASIPRRFAIDDIDPSADHVSQRITIGNDAGRVKQEVQLDFMEGSKGGNTVLPHFSTSDYMSVISK